MDSIKKFFEKKKKDAKFKMAGPGQTLGAPRTPGKSVPSSSKRTPDRAIPTSESRRAGAAALDRLQTQGPKTVDW